MLGPTRARVFTPKVSIDDPGLREQAQQVLPQLPSWLPLADRIQFQLQIRATPLFIDRAVSKWHPDIIHQHFATYGDGAVRASQRLGVPLITTLHGGDAYRLADPGDTRMVRWYAESLARVSAQSHRLLAVSRFLADEAIGVGWPADKIEVHYQGTDTDFFHPNESVYAAEDHDHPIVLAVGAIAPHKGAVQIAQASAELAASHPHRLIFVGDGPQRGEVERIAATRPHIELVGSTDRQGVRDWLQRADLFVMNSHPGRQGRREAAGLVASEAQACGVPVAIARSGGTPEMFEEGVSGFGFPEASNDGLRESLALLLSLPREERQAMGRAGRDFVVGQRSLTSSLGQLEHIWESLL
ncbi:MAG: glycosyltransferase [Brooklawnia sp.]